MSPARIEPATPRFANLHLRPLGHTLTDDVDCLNALNNHDI